MTHAAWHSAGRTQRGKQRMRNEDAFLDCPQQGCWAVADGMGGHQAGDIASQAVIDPGTDFDLKIFGKHRKFREQ